MEFTPIHHKILHMAGSKTAEGRPIGASMEVYYNQAKHLEKAGLIRRHEGYTQAGGNPKPRWVLTGEGEHHLAKLRNKEKKEMSMTMLRTPAKKIVRESIQGVTEEATMADAIGAFHSAGCASAAGAPNGKDPNSYVITCTGMIAGSFQQKQHEIDANLKTKGLRLVSVQYHEDPVTHATTHHCVVKPAVTI